jgi:S-formylglutathione hydrolase FrmB
VLAGRGRPFYLVAMQRILMRWTALACVALCGCTAIGNLIVASANGPPRRDGPSGTVHEDLFFAPSLGVSKRLVVYLPPSYGRDTTRRYPVAYYLHGLSGTETDWLSKGSIDAVADSLFSRGVPEMIIVLPDGDDGWYTTWVSQVAYRTCADTLHNESPERYCVAHERYDDYIARDVVQHVDSTYRTRRDRDARGIGGLSMGGYGAISIALRHPEVFGFAASHSGVLSPMYIGPRPFVEPIRYATTVDDLKRATGGFWPRYLLYWGTDLDRWRAADPSRLAALAVQRGRMPALFIDCGQDDGFVDQNRAFHAELTRLGVRHEYAEWPGAHTWRYWSSHVGQSLAWMGRQWR